MIFRDLFHTGVRAANANAPALLTAFGAVGTVTTAILTARASFQAAEKILVHETENNVALTKTEKVKLVWPLYIGAVSSGVLTCGAVIMAHRVSSRRAAALAAAYALSEGRLEEYQAKIKEKFGIKEEKEARDELAQEKVHRAAHDAGIVTFGGVEGKVLIFDEYTGRFFYSTVETVNRAVNEVNREVLNSMGNAVTLSAFYELIGLETVSISDYMGWNTNEMCEIEWSTTTTPDGATAVHSFEFVNRPIQNPEASSSFR